MTIEKALYVIVPAEMAAELANLQERADAALRRAAKLPVGDTKEIARFETLSTQIERKAIAYAAVNPDEAALSDSTPKTSRSLLTPDSLSKPDHGLPNEVCELLKRGLSVVVAARPHTHGTTIFSSEALGPRPPAEPWKATRYDKRGAETERFSAVIEEAIAGGGGKTVLNPLAVSNRVLTETLRRYVHAESNAHRIDIPVEYGDGSTAAPLPLRAVAMSKGPLPDWPVLRFTLLSIRHVEMDHLVDGAWFRNLRISRRGTPNGLIDADAFAISSAQLTRIRETGPRIIEMYQTGFQPAVTGFYRAVIHALHDHPGSVCVVPKFFVGKGFNSGGAWLTT